MPSCRLWALASIQEPKKHTSGLVGVFEYRLSLSIHIWALGMLDCHPCSSPQRLSHVDQLQAHQQIWINWLYMYLLYDIWLYMIYDIWHTYIELAQGDQEAATEVIAKLQKEACGPVMPSPASFTRLQWAGTADNFRPTRAKVPLDVVDSSQTRR